MLRVLGTAMWLAFAAQAGRADETSESRSAVVVFVQPGISAVAVEFEKVHLPVIARMAQEQQLALKVVDVREGAPLEVTTTPLIVLQNDRGRAFYFGRYTTHDRIRSFLRAASAAGQGDAMIERERVPVWSGGRAIIAAPLKIAAVTGTRPEGYDDEAFTAEATRSILAGFSRFQMAERVALHRSDRSFYMDFNPWCGEDETLFLSVELYSPFHCRKPVHRNAPNPLVGPWTERDRLFKEAAAALEEAVARCTGDPDGGDGLDPVDDSIAVVSWESLGLALAARREGAGAAVKSGPLSRAWTLDTDSTEGSSLVFHFPAPLDGYVGEVGKVTGSLELAEGYFLSGSRGWFEADPASVTMGESDLDDALRGTSYLDVKRFPASRFTIRSVSCDGMAIQFGTGTRAALEGTFEMKGVSIPLALTAEFEPRESVEGETRLVMDGTFTIPLEPFDLEGPDGPPEASQSLMFALRFVHVPATEP